MKKLQLFIPVILFLLSSCNDNNILSSQTNTNDDQGNPNVTVLASPNIKAVLTNRGDSIRVSWDSVQAAKFYLYKVDDGEEIKTSHRIVKLNKTKKKISVKAKGDNSFNDSDWSTFNFQFGDLDIVSARLYDNYWTTLPRTVDTEIEKILVNLKDDGSFSDVDYNNTVFDIGADKKSVHLKKLQEMVYAYKNADSKFYNSEDFYEKIVKVLDFWVSQGYTDQNWWHRIIGFPNDLIPVFTILADELKEKNEYIFSKSINYFKYSLIARPDEQGANATDICKFSLATAVLEGDLEYLNKILGIIGAELTTTKSEGVMPDYSFSQHVGNGKQLYLGTYGTEYCKGIFFFMDLLADTMFQFTQDKIMVLDNLFTHGVRWMWYKGTIDDNQCGRAIFRDGVRSGEIAEGFKNFTKSLISYNTPLKSEHQKTLNMMEGNEEITGNIMFPVHDYMTHRGNGYWTSVRMTSTRTVGNESGSGEGNLNYHTGHGVNYLKVHGDEYRKLSSKWNWQMLPGITVVVDNRNLPLVNWGMNGGNDDSFASGASDGEIGVCGFKYNKKGDYTWANKGWFFFKDYIVCLGSNVGTSKVTGPLVTTINQTLEKSSEELNVSGGGGRYFWNNDIGYFIPDITINENESVNMDVKSIDDYKLFLLSIKHGVKSNNKKYEYVIFPNITKDQLMQKKETPYELLSNTPTVQSVMDKSSGTILSIFYSAGKVSVGNNKYLSVNKPCFIIYKTDGTYVATNPYGGGNIDIIANIN